MKKYKVNYNNNMKITHEKKIENNLSQRIKDNSISFKCYSHIPEEIDEIWTHKTIEMYKNDIPVGYIKLMFYDNKQAIHPIHNVLDYFALIKSNKNPIPWFKEKDIEFFSQFKFLNPIEYITEKYTKEYKEFISLWENKPTVEMVKIYDETDKKCVKHYEFPSILEHREITNFKHQGLAKTLYFAAALWMKEEKKSVHSSIKQTQDGQNMWKSIQKNPQFILSCETISKVLNGKPSEIVRNSISIK